MRNLPMMMLSLLLLTGMASAQYGTSNEQEAPMPKRSYIGAAFGSPFSLQYGFGKPVLAGDDFRIHMSGDFSYLVTGFDFIFDLDTLGDDTRSMIYVGGGPALGMNFTGDRDNVIFAINIGAFAGIDYQLSEEFSAFAEGGFSSTVGANFSSIKPRGSLGVKYYF